MTDVALTARLARRRRLRVSVSPGRVAWPAAVVALAAVAAVVRGSTALGAPLWIDEGISIGIARHPLTQIPGLLREDGSPPVYYVLLHWWMAIFGSSPSATHALSVVFAVLAVPACAWAAWPFGPRAGVLAAALAAFSPFVGEYADETRMYTLAFMLAALATGAFVRAFLGGRRPWAAGFGALTALLCLTHGWGVFFAAGAACALPVALAAARERRRLAVDALLAGATCALLVAPWLPTLLFQAAHTGAPWSHVPDARSLSRAGSRMLHGRTPEIMLVVVAVGGLLTGARAAAARTAGLVAVAVLAIATLLSAYLISRLDQPAWALRYLAVPLAPLLVAFGAGLDRAGAAGVLTAAAVCLFFWAGTPTAPALSDKSNVGELAMALGGELPRGSLVASPQPEQVPLLARELGADRWYVTPFGVTRDPGVVDWIDALRRLRASRVRATLAAAVRGLPPGGRVLLVAPRFGHADSPWTRAVARREHRWRRWLARNPRLVEIDRYTPTRFASRATVAGVLYERLARPAHGAAKARAALRLAPRLARRLLRSVLAAAGTSPPREAGGPRHRAVRATGTPLPGA